MGNKSVEIVYNEDLDRYELNLDKDLVVNISGNVYTFANNIFQQSQEKIHLNTIPQYKFEGENLEEFLKTAKNIMYQKEQEYMDTVYEIEHGECSNCDGD